MSHKGMMAEPAKAIAAYDVPERIARYDLDMDVMHPMADVARLAAQDRLSDR